MPEQEMHIFQNVESASDGSPIIVCVMLNAQIIEYDGQLVPAIPMSAAKARKAGLAFLEAADSVEEEEEDCG